MTSTTCDECGIPEIGVGFGVGVGVGIGVGVGVGAGLGVGVGIARGVADEAMVDVAGWLVAPQPEIIDVAAENAMTKTTLLMNVLRGKCIVPPE